MSVGPGVGYCLIKSSAERGREGQASSNNTSQHNANSTLAPYTKHYILPNVQYRSVLFRAQYCILTMTSTQHAVSPVCAICLHQGHHCTEPSMKHWVCSAQFPACSFQHGQIIVLFRAGPVCWRVCAILHLEGGASLSTKPKIWTLSQLFACLNDLFIWSKHCMSKTFAHLTKTEL